MFSQKVFEDICIGSSVSLVRLIQLYFKDHVVLPELSSAQVCQHWFEQQIFVRDFTDMP